MEYVLPFTGLGSLLIFIIALLTALIGLIFRKGWAKKGLIWSLLPLLIFLICIGIDKSRGSAAVDNEEMTDSAEEELYLTVTNATYNKEKDSVTVKMDTNLPDDTEVNIHIYHQKDLGDYVENPVVKDGKLVAVLGDQDGELVVNGPYTIQAIVFVSESEENPHFYEQYGDSSEVLTMVDPEVKVEDYTDHYVIDYGTIGDVKVAGGHTNEESDKALKEAIRKKDEQEEKELQERKQNAEELRFAELKKNPDKHAGEYVKYQGEIVQIMEDESSATIRLAVTKDSYGYDYNDIVMVTYDDTTPFVEEDVVTVYGTIVGSHTYESQAGYNITVPLMEAEVIE